MSYKVSCPHCNGHIEFDAEHLGRTTPCPHCNGEIILTIVSPEPQPAVEKSSAWSALGRFFFNKEQNQLGETRLAEQRRHRIAATMEQVRNGTWQVGVKNIVLLTGERALWCQSAALVDAAAIGQPEQTSAYAVTTKIFKSITTRLAYPRSNVAATSAPRGSFIVTNCRLIFMGTGKTFLVRYENLTNLHSTQDGIRFSSKGQATSYGLKYDQPNGDVIIEMINFGIEQAKHAGANNAASLKLARTSV